MKLITRSDFDGIASAVLLREVEIIEDIAFAEPRDFKNGEVEVTKNHVIANLPYHPNCGLWFDHHLTEGERTDIAEDFEGSFRMAPSAAHVIYHYYKSHRFHKFEYLLSQVDKIDSAQLDLFDITDPEGWVLLSFILDPRTGMDTYQGGGLEGKALLLKMVDLMADYTANEILEMRDVKLRARHYFKQQERFEEMLQKRSRLDGPAIITDTRGQSSVPTGNRFLVYTLFQEGNISVRLMDPKDPDKTLFTLGRSVINRTSFTNIGDLCAEYGGGGHEGAGTFVAPREEADTLLAEVISRIKAEG